MDHHENDQFGGLDPSTFTYDGIDYEVIVVAWFRGLRRFDGAVHYDALDFYIYEHVMPEDWVLRLEDRRFYIKDANAFFLAGSEPTKYKAFWPHPGLSLSFGADYDVSLSRDPAIAARTRLAAALDASELPTAWIEALPERHDGNTEFTFELQISDDATLAASTVRNSAFEVTGGTIISATRVSPPSNTHWSITVDPTSNAPVTLVLSCDAVATTCITDDLSVTDRVEVTVPGPPAPQIGAVDGFTVPEGTTASMVLPATDEDTVAEDLRWSIVGGADQAKFALTPSGVLTFGTDEDYEAPDDANQDGTYEVTVQVSDGSLSDTADITVTLSDRNEAPNADAGADQDGIEPGETVTLAAEGTDPDSGDALTYSWTQTGGPDITLTGGDTDTATFDAPSGLTEDTSLTFRLRVTDSGGLHHDDEVDITVLAEPALTATAERVPDSHGGAQFSFDLHFSVEPYLSYVTLRDTAFEVTGGTILRARRKTPGSDLSWTILVRPTGNDDVVLVLAGNRACNTTGAICTADSDQLSETLTITVPANRPSP